jgi:hypothetical protein
MPLIQGITENYRLVFMLATLSREQTNANPNSSGARHKWAFASIKETLAPTATNPFPFSLSLS